MEGHTRDPPLPARTVRSPGGHPEGSGQYVAGDPPSQNDWPAAFIGRKWMGEAEREAITVKAAGCSAAGAVAGAAATMRGRREEMSSSFMVGVLID
jgi:hypothetical protein